MPADAGACPLCGGNPRNPFDPEECLCPGGFVTKSQPSGEERSFLTLGEAERMAAMIAFAKLQAAEIAALKHERDAARAELEVANAWQDRAEKAEAKLAAFECGDPDCGQALRHAQQRRIEKAEADLARVRESHEAAIAAYRAGVERIAAETKRQYMPEECAGDPDIVADSVKVVRQQRDAAESQLSALRAVVTGLAEVVKEGRAFYTLGTRVGAAAAGNTDGLSALVTDAAEMNRRFDAALAAAEKGD